MARMRLAGVLLTAGLVALADPCGRQALAAEPAPAGPAAVEPAAVEPAAANLLRAALERIAAAKAFSFVAEIANDIVLPSGQGLQFTGRIETAVRRPDGLRVAFDGEQRSTRSWYDGRSFTLLDVGQNVYACSEGPARLEDLLDTMKERLGFTPPLSLLLHEDVVTTALARVKGGFVVGPATIGGVAVQHLAFSGERIDWQLWVTEGAEPVIRRIVVSFKLEAGSPQFSAAFLAWDFGPRFGDDLFTFAPPAGAMQCDFRSLQR
ncbi:MAG TPA: DUF2092 domain-containing protein [Candidatus Methanoperedens sp.]|nr:DUF2092 domain-containing protein [Candidatus Methanoperedens sp.]